jgi:hypothetical protein
MCRALSNIWEFSEIIAVVTFQFETFFRFHFFGCRQLLDVGIHVVSHVEIVPLPKSENWILFASNFHLAYSRDVYLEKISVYTVITSRFGMAYIKRDIYAKFNLDVAKNVVIWYFYFSPLRHKLSLSRLNNTINRHCLMVMHYTRSVESTLKCLMVDMVDIWTLFRW